MFLLMGLAGAVYAQKISVDARVYQGTVWRHTPKLTTQTGELIGGQEIGLRFHTTGRRDWEAWQHYPGLGITLNHFHLGEGSHGNAFSVLPYLNLPLWRSGRWGAYFRVGTGLAWVTRPYDWFTNPTQNAVGSHWNNVTQLTLSAEMHANPRISFHAGGGLTHFSNGGTALPNYGVNVLSGWAGASFFLQPLEKNAFQAAKTSKHSVSRRFGAQIQQGAAMLEIASFDGPKYLLLNTSVAGSFQISQTNRVLLGLDYEFNTAIFEWGLHSARFGDEATARRGATRLALFAAEEFLFGDISIVLQVGYYAGPGGINAYVPKPLYAKMSARYYLPKLLHTRIRPFVGVSNKAHNFTAEYISYNVGIGF